MKRTKAEMAALIEKRDHPDKDVKCPTCGGTLSRTIDEFGAAQVRCDGCGVNAGERGL